MRSILAASKIRYVIVARSFSFGMKLSFFSKCCIALVTTVLFWAIAFGILCMHQRLVDSKRGKETYRIRSIASVACGPDSLPNSLLISLLDLSEDLCLYDQRADYWAQRLMTCPAIMHARSWRMPPQTVGIEYRLREPIAFVGGTKNVALDGTGAVFFVYPFFSPKRLPVLHLPLEGLDGLPSLQKTLACSKETKIGIQLIKEMSCLSTKLHLTLTLVDLRAFADKNFFRREVVVGFSHLRSPEKVVYVRIHPKTLHQSVQKMERLLLKVIYSSGLSIDSPFRGGIVDLRFEGRVLCSGEICS